MRVKCLHIFWMDFLWEVELLEQCQYFRNSVQLEKNILSGSVDMSHPSLGLVSQDAKSLIRVLLEVDTRRRWSARQCLRHK